MDVWNLIKIDWGLKKLPGFWFKSTHDSKRFSESWFVSYQLMTQWCYSFPVSFDPFLGIQLYCRLGMTFFGFSSQVLTSYGLFWAFDTSTFPINWFESAHDSSSISETWIDSTHDSNGFSRNWLRINPWLNWIPRYWFRSTHYQKLGVHRIVDFTIRPYTG